MMVAGRSHRSDACVVQIQKVINLIKDTLDLPAEYQVAILPGSNTGAFESALWCLLGELPIDVFTWESFGDRWVSDITKQLELENVKIHSAPYGEIADLNFARSEADICFTWNGTSSGVRIPDTSWIPNVRVGLTFCDATSAIFSERIDWDKLDVTTFSWQKAMGGEAGLGTLVLSPRAVERLRSFQLKRAIPRVMNIGASTTEFMRILNGATINTPSMLSVADALDSLMWIKSIGGWPATVAKTLRNFMVLSDWYKNSTWVCNLVEKQEIQSRASVCLKINDEAFIKLRIDEKWSFIDRMIVLLEANKAAFDVRGHRDAPPSLRVWCGPTVETSDLELMVPWLDWAFKVTKNEMIA